MSKLFVFVLFLISYSNADPIVGVNIGGWMVLEPWITPSLFYRFLGKNRETGAAYDTYTLCETLGP